MPLMAVLFFVLFVSSPAYAGGVEASRYRQLGIHFVCGPAELLASFDRALDLLPSKKVQIDTGRQQRTVISLQKLDKFVPCEMGSSHLRSLAVDHHAKIRIDTLHFKETMNHDLPLCAPHQIKKGNAVILTTYIVDLDGKEFSFQDCIGQIVSSIVGRS